MTARAIFEVPDRKQVAGGAQEVTATSRGRTDRSESIGFSGCLKVSTKAPRKEEKGRGMVVVVVGEQQSAL